MTLNETRSRELCTMEHARHAYIKTHLQCHVVGLKRREMMAESIDINGGIEDDVEYEYESMSSSEVLEKLEEVGKNCDVILLHVEFVDVSFDLYVVT